MLKGGEQVKALLGLIKETIVHIKREGDMGSYIIRGRKAFSRGCDLGKFKFSRNVLKDQAVMTKFQALGALPDGYGYSYDERVVE